jgi:hypothetical protein
MNEITPDEHRILVDAIQDSATVVHKGRMMNERIKQLAEQATTYIEPTSNSGEGWIFDKEKFAELLIKDCIEINKQELAFNAFEKLLNRYNEHFGIEE